MSICISTYAQNTIKVKVKDASTGEALYGASVFWMNTNTGSATDLEGKAKIPDLYDSDIEALEVAMDLMNESLPPLTTFVLPGGHQSVSFIHIARCVCRRAERIATSLSEDTEVDERVLKYLNRLSDYLFVLSRKFSKDLNAKEVPWKPRM